MVDGRDFSLRAHSKQMKEKPGMGRDVSSALRWLEPSWSNRPDDWRVPKVGLAVAMPDKGPRLARQVQVRISIIIPMLNEDRNIARTLASTRSASTAEVIVVDGGSWDNSVNVAKSFSASVLRSQVGRAKQMNIGAKAATGDVLLFLHADTQLPESFDEHIHGTLERTGAGAGAFLLSIDAPHLGLRFIEKMVNWRSRIFHLPYGDQAIFVKSSVFHDVGGFPNIPIMEDYEMILRLRKQGRIAIAPEPVITSARQWNQMGICKTTLMNQLAIAAYSLGVAPLRIARWYDKSRVNCLENTEIVAAGLQAIVTRTRTHHKHLAGSLHTQD